MTQDIYPAPANFGLVDKVVYTASGSFVKADYPGATHVRVTVVGGGGGGGGVASTSGSGATAAAGSGGGGGTSIKLIPISDLLASETVTIASGGAGGAAGNNIGSAGGTTSFGAHCSASGGGGGDPSTGTSAVLYRTSGTTGGAGSGGDVNFRGSWAGLSWRNGADGGHSSPGGDSSMGNGGRSVIVNDPGSSPGQNGEGYGGGGSGAVCSNGDAASGGDGSDGIAVVEVYSSYKGNMDNVVVTNAAGQTLLGDGTAAAPTYAFGSDPDTGLYLSLAGELSFASAGSQALGFDANGMFLLSGTQVRASNAATPGTPAYTFGGDTDTGIYRSAADTLGFAAAGSEVMTLNSTTLQIGELNLAGQIVSSDSILQLRSTAGSDIQIREGGTSKMIYDASAGDWNMYADVNFNANNILNAGLIRVGDGSVSIPSLAFQNDADTGFAAYGSAGQLLIISNGSLWGSFFKSGNESRLLAASNTDYMLHDAGSDQWKFVLNSVDEFLIGLSGCQIPNVYSTTSGSAGDVGVTSTGLMYRSTSSAKAKKNIQPFRDRTGRGSVLDVEVVEFDGMIGNLKNPMSEWEPTGKRHLGLTYENVAENFPEAAIDPDPDVENDLGAIDWNAVVSGVIAEMQEMKQENDDLRARIETLESA